MLRKVIWKYGNLYSHVEIVYALMNLHLVLINNNHQLKNLSLSSQLINTYELKFNLMISKLNKAYQLQELLLTDTHVDSLDCW